MKLPLSVQGSQKARIGAAAEAGPLIRLLLSAAAAGAQQLGEVLAPAIVVCLGLYVSALESGGGRAIDRSSCTCSCWDERFKGRHQGESQNYKNVYWNLTLPTAILFIWTALWVKLLGTALERIYGLFRAGNLRYAAMIPALGLFYPLFYGGWVSWNYINQEWPLLLPSQLFFLATELLPAYCTFQLLDKAQEPTPAMATLCSAVALAHMALALKEKVLWGFVWPEAHTASGRDVGLMLGDALVLAFFLRAGARCKLNGRELRQQLVVGGCAAAGLVVLYLLLFSYRLD